MLVIEWSEDYGVRRCCELPTGRRRPAATDDEVHQLLTHFGSAVGSLDQAIEAHTRGDWAAAQWQIRTFLESVFRRNRPSIYPADSAAAGSYREPSAHCSRNEASCRSSGTSDQRRQNYVNVSSRSTHRGLAPRPPRTTTAVRFRLPRRVGHWPDFPPAAAERFVPELAPLRSGRVGSVEPV